MRTAEAQVGHRRGPALIRSIRCAALTVAQAGLKAAEAHGGAVTLIQRFGSAANLNIHLHWLLLDGVYRVDARELPELEPGQPVFVPAPAPGDADVAAVLQKIIVGLMTMLVRRGVLVEEGGQAYLADVDDASDRVALQVAPGQRPGPSPGTNSPLDCLCLARPTGSPSVRVPGRRC